MSRSPASKRAPRSSESGEALDRRRQTDSESIAPSRALLQEEHGDAPMLLERLELALELRISLRAVDKLRGRGGLPAPIRLGRSVRWSAEEIRA